MKRKKQQSNNSPFWKPEEEGETLEGTFSHLSQTQENDDGTPGMAISFGGKLVGMSVQMKNALFPIIEAGKLKPGKTKLRVVFLEKKSIGKGRKVNQLQVFCDEKELDTGNFKKLSQEEAFALLSVQSKKDKKKKK